MLISVIMANYNGGRFISEAIESVLNQDFKNFEFIIVDDASTDDSKDIIESFHAKFKNIIKPIYQIKNCGQGESFNIGVSSSNGDIVCFIDSDDYWYNEKLTKVYEQFYSNRKSVIFQHNLYVLRNKVITKQKFHNVLITGDYFRETVKTREIPTFIPSSGLSFRKEILTKVLPIPKEFITCADGYLTRTCFCYGDVSSDNDCWGIYRVHEKNCTFDNPDFDNRKYLFDLLVPALNRYYKNNEIDLKLRSKKSIIEKLIDVSIRRILYNIVPEEMFEKFEKSIER